MRSNQVMMAVLVLFAMVLFSFKFRDNLEVTTADQLALFLVFPFAAFGYYTFLRNIGWLKPFLVAFTWAGIVTIIPVLFYNFLHKLPFDYNWVSFWLFTKNFVFISVLCILFDIKDYASDHRHGLITLTGRLGLRNTIFRVLLPVVLLGFISFIIYSVVQDFHIMKILLNLVPFILLAITVYSLRKRKSLMYYLSVVDGLMLVKGIAGSLAMWLF